MSEWQPIETAPKDGRDLLIFDKFHKTAVIAFYREDGRSPGKYGKFVWQLHDEGGSLAEQSITHWMPLPSPPVMP